MGEQPEKHEEAARDRGCHGQEEEAEEGPSLEVSDAPGERAQLAAVRIPVAHGWSGGGGGLYA